MGVQVFVGVGVLVGLLLPVGVADKDTAGYTIIQFLLIICFINYCLVSV